MALRLATRTDTETPYRWIAIRVGPSPPTVCAEFVVVDELIGLGVAAYCPTGQRFVTWEHGRRAPRPSGSFPCSAAISSPAFLLASTCTSALIGISNPS